MIMRNVRKDKRYMSNSTVADGRIIEAKTFNWKKSDLDPTTSRSTRQSKSSCLLRRWFRIHVPNHFLFHLPPLCHHRGL